MSTTFTVPGDWKLRMTGYEFAPTDLPALPTAEQSLDAPVPRPKSESQTSFFQVKPQFTRFAIGINTVMLVDSCVELAGETEALVAEFLGSLRME